MAHNYFSEEQRFTDSPLIYVFAVSALGALGGLIYAAFTTNNTAEMEELLFAMVFSILILFGIGWLLFSIRLETRVENGQLRYRMPPLISKTRIIKKTDITHWEVITYKPVIEYGGWGMRQSIKNGKALNIRGNKGLRLELSNGKKLLIGTQKPDMLTQALKKMMENDIEHG
jgi:hypothetical protein